MTDEADRTIFDGSELNSEERDAVRKGEERGKRAAERENPERFGIARSRARGKKNWDKNYDRIIFNKQ